jgi:RNA polymerase primary sigma factor
MEKKDNRDDVLETYIKQVKAIKLLSSDEERDLSKKVLEGDSKAVHELVNANLRLVVKIAALFSTKEIPILDLIQEGNLGLIHAAQKFDYRKNVRFCTYASWWIRQYMSRFLSNKFRIVRLPQRKEEILRKIQRTYHELSQTLMHQPSNEDIAAELGIPVQDVDYITNMTAGHLPLDMGSEGDLLFTESHADYTYCPERNLIRKTTHAHAMKLFNKLKSKEKHIINSRYQLNGCQRQTLREISDELDISPETVRQIEMRALKKIRMHISEFKEYMNSEAI